MHTGLFTELIRLGFQQRTLLKNSVTRFLTFLLFINRNTSCSSFSYTVLRYNVYGLDCVDKQIWKSNICRSVIFSEEEHKKKKKRSQITIFSDSWSNTGIHLQAIWQSWVKSFVIRLNTFIEYQTHDIDNGPAKVERDSLKHYFQENICFVMANTIPGLLKISAPLWARGQDAFVVILGERVQAQPVP